MTDTSTRIQMPARLLDALDDMSARFEADGDHDAAVALDAFLAAVSPDWDRSTDVAPGPAELQVPAPGTVVITADVAEAAVARLQFLASLLAELSAGLHMRGNHSGADDFAARAVDCNELAATLTWAADPDATVPCPNPSCDEGSVDDTPQIPGRFAPLRQFEKDCERCDGDGHVTRTAGPRAASGTSAGGAA